MTTSAVPQATQPQEPAVIENVEQASTNFFWRREIDGQVFDLQTTLRGVLSPAQVAGHLEMIQTALTVFISGGAIAKSVGLPQKATEPAPVTAKPQVETVAVKSNDTAVTTTAPAAPSKPEEPKAQNGPLTFETAALHVTMTGGKKLFRIGGGQFAKFGVTVWPEVLGKHTDLEQLEAKDYDFPGFTAYYILNDAGKPQKITRLEKIEK